MLIDDAKREVRGREYVYLHFRQCLWELPRMCPCLIKTVFDAILHPVLQISLTMIMKWYKVDFGSSNQEVCVR